RAAAGARLSLHRSRSHSAEPLLDQRHRRFLHRRRQHAPGPGFRGAAMMRSTSLTSVLLPLLLAGALSLGPGHAQEVRTVIGTSAAERYAAEVVELSRLQRAGDPASKIEL